METTTKNKLTIKSLMGLATLTVDQLIKYFDHPNYQLRGSDFALVANINIIDGQNAILREGEIVGIIKEDSQVFILISDGNKYSMTENVVLIIFKEGNPTYAIHQ